MIRISQLKLPQQHDEAALEAKIRKKLKLSKEQRFTYKVKKRSLDARKKPELYYVYTILVDIPNEARIVKKLHLPEVAIESEKAYKYPASGEEPLLHRPVIVGAGPAGLFCACLLTECGYAPIVLERGKRVEERRKDVENFWKNGKLLTSSNVQFGEGGAGTFSDGKLNTAVKDPAMRNQFVLETFVKYGAPAEICYEAKPHIGTDILSSVIANMRKALIEKGCEFRFETEATDFHFSNETLTSVQCGATCIPAEVLVLAPGHSARDTFQTLYERNLPMSAKNFAVGFRVEHPQEMIDRMMYGKTDPILPAAPYKVTSNFPNGRGVYSFCMCPGGYVVNSSSEPDGIVVNGMSYSGRSGANANSAIIVSVDTADFGGTDALAGVRYQRTLEQKTYALGNGKIPQQLYGDYCQNRASQSYGAYSSQTKGESCFCNLRGLFSEDMEHTFMQGMEHFSKIIPSFSREDAILSGVESRTSSPVRIHRDENFESAVHGIYPCGEGAGYAGGIVSAAMDGLKVAEAIISRYTRPQEL
jgi:hypothetical protein